MNSLAAQHAGEAGLRAAFDLGLIRPPTRAVLLVLLHATLVADGMACWTTNTGRAAALLVAKSPTLLRTLDAEVRWLSTCHEWLCAGFLCLLFGEKLQRVPPC